VRRTLILLGLGAGVFGAAAFVGFLMSARLVPERVRQITEANLAELLDTQVEVDETQLYLRFGLAVEARGISAWPGPEGPALEIRRALMRVDLLPLLFGEVRPRWLRFEEPRLLLQRDESGAIVSPFAWEPLAGPEETDGPAYELSRRSIDAGLGALLGLPVSAPHVEVVGGELVVVRAGDPDAASLELRGFEARMSRNPSYKAGRLDVRTGLVRGGRDGGRLELAASVAGSGDMEAVVSLDRVDLGSLASWAPHLAAHVQLAGRATGDLELRMEHDKPHRLDGDLQVWGLRLRLPRAGQAPVVLSSDSGSLRAALLLTERRLELWSGRLQSGDLRVGLEGTLELPPRADSRIRMVARAPELELSALEGALGWLPQDLRSGAEPLLAQIESGRVEELELRLATPLSSFDGRQPDAYVELLRDLELRARLEAGGFQISEDGRLDQVSASILFDGDRLDVRDAKASWNEQPLPRLNASLTGASHLIPLSELRCQQPADVAPIPGRRALEAWLDARRNPDEGRTWSQLSLEADWLRHPALGCGIEHARAIVAPTDGGFSFEVQQAIWAGAPVKARGVYQGGPREALTLSVALGPAWEPVTEAAPDVPWASGRFRLIGRRFGPWRIKGAHGSFEGRDGALVLHEAALDLAPDADLQADLTLDLSDPEQVPYQVGFRVARASIPALAASLDVDPQLADGSLTAAGVIVGRLRGEESPFVGATGHATMMARDGVLRRDLPPLLAITVASEAVNPVADREEIPYDGIDAVLELEGGILRTESLSLQGPWLRAMVSGEVDVIHSPNPTESVVALFFFRNLDSLISKVPLLNRVLLGEDENLINAYFALSGPFGEPKARLIPVKTLSSGPASFVLEGFPAFVRGGLSRLRSVLPGGGSESPVPEERLGS
jgi:hypothetical protein